MVRPAKMRRIGLPLMSLALAASFVAVSLAASRAQTSQPTYRAGTVLVEVSAVVTRDGETVTDLTRSEVQVFEDGREQALAAFEFVDLQTVTGPAKRRDFVLMLDDLLVNARQTKAVQEVALAFVDLLGPDDRLAIVNTSPFELVMQLSTDRRKARSLIKKFRGQMNAPGSAQSPDVLARIHLQVLRNVALALQGSASERRAVLVISEGHFIQPPGDGRLNEPDPRVLDDFFDVIRQAALANIAVYGINPTGLEARGAPVATASSDSANAAAAQAEGSRVADDSARRRHGTVGQLADITGGIMTVDRNVLDANLPRLLQDSRRYYRLAYVQPDGVAGSRDTPRRIDVKVLRPGVEVRFRRAYLPK